MHHPALKLSVLYKCGHKGTIYFPDGARMDRIVEDAKAASEIPCEKCKGVN